MVPSVSSSVVTASRISSNARTAVVRESVLAKSKKRLPWLLITLCLGLMLAVFLGSWRSLLDKYVALTFFVPLLAALAGNAGIQASTLVVRALATGEEEGTALGDTLRRETGVGLLTGSVCGMGGFVFAYLFCVLFPEQSGMVAADGTSYAATFAIVVDCRAKAQRCRSGTAPRISTGRERT